MSSEPPPPPPFDTRPFWIDQLVASLIAGAGITVFSQYPWPGAGLFIGGLGWLLYLRLEPKQMNTQSRIPNMIALAVLFLATVTMGYDIYLRLSGSTLQSPAFTGWGGGEDGTCTVVVDGAQLKQWQEKARLIMACGLPNPSLDRMRDDHIAVSKPFTIIPETINISTPLNPLIVAEVRQRNAEHLGAVRGQPVKISFEVWFEIAVIPYACDISTIKTLYDIERCDGKLLGSRSGAEFINANSN